MEKGLETVWKECASAERRKILSNSSLSVSWTEELQRSEEVANRKEVYFKQVFARVSRVRGSGISDGIHLDCSRAPLGWARGAERVRKGRGDVGTGHWTFNWLNSCIQRVMTTGLRSAQWTSLAERHRDLLV